MYLKINLNGTNNEKVKEILKQVGVAYEEVESTLVDFCSQEAEHRLDCYLESSETFLTQENIKELSDLNSEVRTSVISALAKKYKSEDIFDYDYMDDLRDSVLKNYCEGNLEKGTL